MYTDVLVQYGWFSVVYLLNQGRQRSWGWSHYSSDWDEEPVGQLTSLFTHTHTYNVKIDSDDSQPNLTYFWTVRRKLKQNTHREVLQHLHGATRPISPAAIYTIFFHTNCFLRLLTSNAPECYLECSFMLQMLSGQQFHYQAEQRI